MGIFGENFPYTNFHNLNMDWIIKIAKDFLDQYTHIQETIENGLNELDEKAETLEELLQEWYDTHSEDIANQLSSALSDLNEWYTTHQNYLDQTLEQKIGVFDEHADTKTATCIASIPDDYSTLAKTVTEQGYADDNILDMVKYQFVQTPYSHTYDPSYWQNEIADSYVVGMKIEFTKGYIDTITIHRHSTATDNTVVVFITDLNKVILEKLSGTYTGTEINFPVHKYINQNFYVFIRCINIEFGFVEQPHIERDWYRGTYMDNYTKKVGEAMDGDWRESSAEFCFNFQVNTTSVENILMNNTQTIENEHRNSGTIPEL